MDFNIFKSGPNYTKLKTNLRILVNRLKLLEKKRTELSEKARVEIADYIRSGKLDRARVRVEHIIREDYAVEALERVEMYADLLLARFGLIESQRDVDLGLQEPIASILWATPRLRSEVPEIQTVSQELTAKYGKEFAEACTQNTLEEVRVNEKLIHRMSIAVPSPSLIEKYMVVLASTYNISYTPDPRVLSPEELSSMEPLAASAPGELSEPPAAPTAAELYGISGPGAVAGDPLSRDPQQDNLTLPDIPTSGSPGTDSKGHSKSQSRDSEFDDLEARFNRLKKR